MQNAKQYYLIVNRNCKVFAIYLRVYAKSKPSGIELEYRVFMLQVDVLHVLCTDDIICTQMTR